MGEQGSHTAQYVAADPEEFQPLSAQIPSPFKGGRLVFGDICADLPGGGGRLSERFERSGLAEARADLLVLRGAGKQFAERVEAERERLEGTTGSSLGKGHAQFLKGRLEALQQMPLVKTYPLVNPPERLEDSLLGNISPHTALVRWASAFQAKRDKLRTPDEPQPPSYYVDLGFVVSRWKDGPQCGGILRPAEPSEVRYSLQEESFEEEWNLKAADMNVDKLAEFGWAAIEGKLTPPSAELVRQTLAQRADEDPAIAAFTTVLEDLGLTPAAQAA